MYFLSCYCFHLFLSAQPCCFSALLGVWDVFNTVTRQSLSFPMRPKRLFFQVANSVPNNVPKIVHIAHYRIRRQCKHGGIITIMMEHVSLTKMDLLIEAAIIPSTYVTSKMHIHCTFILLMDNGYLSAYVLLVFRGSLANPFSGKTCA